MQQRSGDVAFAELISAGTTLAMGDEVAVIETIKVDISFSSPVTGSIAKVNPQMEGAPEVINMDPFGEGWLAVISPAKWEVEKESLHSAEEYFSLMLAEAQEQLAFRPLVPCR